MRAIGKVGRSKGLPCTVTHEDIWGEDMMQVALKSWFERSDTPMEKSPVGLLMQRILEESPNMPFDEARIAAQDQLNKASKRKVYRPQTPKQEERRTLATRKHFAKS